VYTVYASAQRSIRLLNWPLKQTKEHKYKY